MVERQPAVVVCEILQRHVESKWGRDHAKSCCARRPETAFSPGESGVYSVASSDNVADVRGRGHQGQQDE
jgi:hypothetical protein